MKNIKEKKLKEKDFKENNINNGFFAENLSIKEALQKIDDYRNNFNEKKEIKSNKIILDISKNLNVIDINDTFKLLEENYQLAHEVLSERTAKHSEISKSVKRQLNYIGFVYYIWNPDNLNIKVIPLIYAFPILDIVNLKEFYYLQKPTMFIDGKPIWFVIRGIPISIEFKLKNVSYKDGQTESLNNFLREIEIKGYKPEEIKAKLQSMYAVYLFGKKHLSIKDYLFFILIIIVIGLIEYLIISSMYSVI